jgi:hypothetical protein
VENSFGSVPYTQVDSIRTFDCTKDSDEFVWHRDRNDRIINIIQGTNWYIQFDDCLPILLETGNKYSIPAMVYHRLLKGTDNLIIEITE